MIPIMPELGEYAETVRQALLDADVRVDVDASDARLPARVRAAVTRKIPLIVVVGRREVEEGTVSVRYRSGQETSMPQADFVRQVRELIDSRSLEGAGHTRAQSSGKHTGTDADS